MKRYERIYHYVKKQTQQLTVAELEEGAGLTTSVIADYFNIQRSNVSKDLNKLVRDGLIGKIDGRPVRYATISAFQHKALTKPVKSYLEQPNTKQITTLKGEKNKKTALTNNDIFNKMIGSNGSMKNSVEQAKAAILYPPKGLNCLIIGPTGSGKTYFAHAMFQFAKLNKVIDPTKELIVFNCADYAHNPELLMSHLFGYAAGSFTGALKAKDGIIHEADGSILFLDEVHRLPPEGQEMVFYFLDHGTYARLGETSKTRKANVRVICATTESTTSSLLNTFVRRIPIIIQLPHFTNRPASEKIDLLKLMMSMEATRIQRKITLSEDVVKSLIGSVSYGNVGQLKSNSQLITARAFLKQMDLPELTITMDQLTDSIKEGLLQLASNRDALAELSKHLEPQLTVVPNGDLITFEADSYELPYNLYEIIGDKAAVLKEDGVDQEVINNFITTDINVHLKSFYKNHGFTFDTENKLVEIVDQTVIDITKDIYLLAQQRLGQHFQTNFIYAMSLHISSFLKRSQNGEKLQLELNENIQNMVLGYPKELAVSEEIKEMIESYFQINVPQSESYYLAVLLISLSENKKNGRIGIVVAAHGDSTASSMVQVVTKLLNATNLRAVDMPLEMSPNEALTKIIAEVKNVNEGNGVILLVDMGSLATFSEEITKQTAIPIKTIDMVTTPIVLEAARKTSLLGTQLKDLYDLLKNFHGYASTSTNKKLDIALGHKPRAIIAICASGEGTAQRMKEMIETSVKTQSEIEIEVIPLSVLDIKKMLPKIEANYRIIATTGITDPKINVPFITMESFFLSESTTIIKQLLSNTQLVTEDVDELTARNICIEYMEQSFSFINPKKMIDPLWEFSNTLKNTLQLATSYSFHINLTMHLAGALERIIRLDTLTLTPEELGSLPDELLYHSIAKQLEQLNHILGIQFPKEEIYYIVQLVKNTQNKTDFDDTLFDDTL
ncbi:sigma-54-dependent transcriptional regulator [Vagococcus intermedius]|uniref:DNA translocase FtsK n=1 Tax=Vagococcus intermedius TaxID=2991418 RepID=A0AAF0CV92_9ENTE|nr:sigma 54-interacting transcriptional regulator [Vagococcus intermedius]WEG73645.1 sigma 54-interacting transcriptional regulator [Vagococcus intermedius]WEG75729.1 sigma 54-interacting transcriptional regulator [Vagococcus intermedius]